MPPITGKETGAYIHNIKIVIVKNQTWIPFYGP
jgi:hypothetical protein